jgi:Mn2+/Fe2+ NRAMP family transporter
MFSFNALLSALFFQRWHIDFLAVTRLLIFTSDVMLMSVPIDDSLVKQFSEATRSPDDLEAISSTALLDSAVIPLDISRMDTLLATIKVLNPFRRLVAPTGHVTFANPIIVTYLGWFIWVVINVANVVGVYQLAVSA